MQTMPTKSEMAAILNGVGIDATTSATVAQLHSLIENVIGPLDLQPSTADTVSSRKQTERASEQDDEPIDDEALNTEDLDREIERLEKLVRLQHLRAHLTEMQTMLHPYERHRGRASRLAFAPRSTSSHTRTTVPSYSTFRAERVTCFNCRIRGHMASRCPRERRPPGGCYHCFGTDHQFRQCPAKDSVLYVGCNSCCNNDVM